MRMLRNISLNAFWRVLKNPVSLVVVVMSLLCACASIGNPSGGPRDEDPPVLVGAMPATGATDVSPSRVVLTFNELVNVKDAFTKVIISPSGSSTPRVSSSGRHVYINFVDSLLPETTYTIDFSNAIEDNNEGNKLEGFAYSFSTGPELDSLRISGMVLGARDLEPQQGMLVGAYPSEVSDSAFIAERLRYVTKTDDRGRFILRGLKEGSYRVYALKDLDNDLRYANPEEEIAFYDRIVTPRAERVETHDTIYNLKTGTVDTVVSRMRTLFLPNDILLRSFNLGKKTQYLVKYERVDSTRLSIIFNDNSPVLPELSVIGHPGAEREMVIEKTQGNDSLTYWLPKRLVGVDSLRVAVRYLRPDSMANLVSGVDTLNFYVSRNLIKDRQKKIAESIKKKMSAKGGAAESASSVAESPFVDIKVESSSEIYSPVKIEFTTPIERMDTAAFRLSEKIDTIFAPYRGEVSIVRADTLNPRLWEMRFKREFGMTYKLDIDTLAVSDIYALSSHPLTRDISTKQESDYSQLSFVLSGYADSIPAFVELLNQGEGVVRAGKVENGRVVFNWIDPGTYYARVTLDDNGNGLYDTGDYSSATQPELTFYFPGKISLKKNFDRQFEWDIFKTAVDLQKPEKLKKNKPERRKGERSDVNEEDEDEEFDPTRNPFDPNDRGSNHRSNRNSGNRRIKGAGSMTNTI